MATKKTNLEKAEEIADAVGGNVYEGYSGRCMYGKKCLGVVCSDMDEAIKLGRKKGFGKASTDNMGLDYIVYWPSIEG